MPVPCIVAYNGKVACTVVYQGVDKFNRASGFPETADHHRASVEYFSNGFLGSSDNFINHNYLD